MEPLPMNLVSSLKLIEAHPLDATAASGIEFLQTHISWIFFTKDRVYKVRKAVELPFVCFATKAERNADCAREVRLNRRLTTDVYLGLAPIVWLDGHWTIGAVREALMPLNDRRELFEHCVVMRRLPRGRDGLSLFESEALHPQQLESTAKLLANFHQLVGLGVPPPYTRAKWLSRVRDPVEESIDLAAAHACAGIGPDLIDRLRRSVQRRFASNSESFDSRRVAGRLVDGHGDLQLAHLWFEECDGPPQVIDCVEFRDDFRVLDVASEVAFLAMDLRYRGRQDLAECFLATYAREADDFDLYRVVDFFIAYRAIVRGAVAAVAASESELGAAQRTAAVDSAKRHLELADAVLAEPAHGVAIAVCGIVGTGKSTAANLIAAAIGGVVVSSDLVRKSLAGLSPTQRGSDHSDLNLYDAELTQRVYSEILKRAEVVVASGRSVVLDATYCETQHRLHLRDWAEELGIHVKLVETLCGEAECLRRLYKREKQGLNASDAGPAFYNVSAKAFQPTNDWPEILAIRTDEENWRATLADTVESWVA